MDAARHVLRYLKGTPSYGILLCANSSLQVHAYCNADWGTCPLTRRSLTSYLVTLGGSPVSWKTKKQPTISHFSAKAEYQSMAIATSELVWLKSLLGSLGVFHDIPMHLYCDSQATLHIAKNPIFHKCTKHIGIDCHFVREKLESGDLTVSYLTTKEQPADIFTKALGKKPFVYLRGKMGMIDPHTPP